jgi:mRNA-degrading endonuclease RelE of RelBE toxin-antitoxin system
VNGHGNWTVKKRKAADRELASLPRQLREEADSVLDELAEDGPAIFGAIEMRGNPNTWRVRFGGGFRIVYRVFEKQRKILVTRIGPRGTVYKGLRG